MRDSLGVLVGPRCPAPALSANHPGSTQPGGGVGVQGRFSTGTEPLSSGFPRLGRGPELGRRAAAGGRAARGSEGRAGQGPGGRAVREARALGRRGGRRRPRGVSHPALSPPICSLGFPRPHLSGTSNGAPAAPRPTFISPHSGHCLRDFTDMLIPGPWGAGRGRGGVRSAQPGLGPQGPPDERAPWDPRRPRSRPARRPPPASNGC